MQRPQPYPTTETHRWATQPTDVLLPTLGILCGFLTLRDSLCSLARSCHSLNRHVRGEYHKQLRTRAIITKNTTRFLRSSVHSHDHLGLQRCVSSLSILTVPQHDEVAEMEEMVQQLYLSPAGFSFPSITSLYLARAGLAPFPNQPCWHVTLNGFLHFASSQPDSLPNLRRLHLAGCTLWKAVGDEVHWSALSCLQRLTHLRIEAQMSRAFSTNTELLTAVCHLPSLESLDLAGTWWHPDDAVLFITQLRVSACRASLKCLVLPQVRWSQRGAAERFAVQSALCQLLSQEPSPGPLEYVGCCDALPLSCELLQSFFSLQQTQVINLSRCTVEQSQFAAFCMAVTQLPRLPSLVTFHLPMIRAITSSPGHFETIHSCLPLLLSRISTIRDLSFEWTGLALDLSSILQGGTRDSLNRLSLKGAAASSALRLHCPALQCLTELALLANATDRMQTHGVVQSLLTSLPMLRCLTLQGWEWESWDVILVIARCCPQLLQLSVAGQSRDSLPADTTAEVARPFFPHLLVLDIVDEEAQYVHRAPYDFAHLQLFLQPPSAVLHSITLSGILLTAHHVMTLWCLPALQQLCAPVTSDRRSLGQPCETFPELRAARRLTEIQLGLRDQEISQDTGEDCQGGMPPQPRSPSEWELLRRDVLRQERTSSANNLLSCGRDVDVLRVRAVFFHELRQLLRAPAVRNVLSSADERERDAVRQSRPNVRLPTLPFQGSH